MSDAVDEAAAAAVTRLAVPVPDGYERVVLVHPSQQALAERVFEWPVQASMLLEPGEFRVHDRRKEA